MNKAKISIDLTQGIIEAEGSESFVKAVYQDFKTNLSQGASGTRPASPKPTASEPSSSSPSKPKTPKKAKSTPSLVKELDLKPDGREALSEFYAKYSPKNNYEKNLIFTYWLKEIAGLSEVSEDHIFTCYRHVSVRTPSAFRQSLFDTSKRKGWIDTADTDDLKVTISGVNHLEHDLSGAADPE